MVVVCDDGYVARTRTSSSNATCLADTDSVLPKTALWLLMLVFISFRAFLIDLGCLSLAANAAPFPLRLLEIALLPISL